jgi:hypothetical protein
LHHRNGLLVEAIGKSYVLVQDDLYYRSFTHRNNIQWTHRSSYISPLYSIHFRRINADSPIANFLSLYNLYPSISTSIFWITVYSAPLLSCSLVSLTTLSFILSRAFDSWLKRGSSYIKTTLRSRQLTLLLLK